MNKIIKRCLSFILTSAVICTSIIDFNMFETKAATTSWTFSYTGSVQSFTVPTTGKYFVEMYGAAGGGAYNISSSITQGGYGGYTKGYINLYAGQTIYVAVGQSGSINGGRTFGGGGAAGNGGGSGGGATHIAFKSGALSSLSSDADRKQVIAVAGGGGGRYTRYGWHNGMGSGGGLYGGGTVSATAPSQSYGYAFGQGQDYVAGGAGGGGWYGGYGATETVHGGSGGSSYIGGLYDAETTFSRHTGHGSLTIQYVGPVKTTLELQLGNHISYNGKTGNVVIEGNMGDTVRINNLVVESGYVFERWEVLTGNFNLVNGVYTFGTSNTRVKALYQAPLILTGDTTELKTKSVIKLQWEQDDPYDKTINLYQSLDNTNWNIIASSDDNYLSQYSKEWNAPGQYEYDIKISGLYSIRLDGAQGSNGHSGTGGKGATTTAKVKLNAGTKLYIIVGGQNGSNGGGAGYSNSYGSSGCGGGATHIATEPGLLSHFGSATNASRHVIAVAAGGGGGGGQGSRGWSAVGTGNGGTGGRTGSNGVGGNNSGDSISDLLAGRAGGGASQTGGGSGGSTGGHHSNGGDHSYYRGCGGGGGGGWFGGGGGGSGWFDFESGHGQGYYGGNGSFGQGGNGGNGSPMYSWGWHTGAGGGGGGGSSWVNSQCTDVSYSQGSHAGNGYAAISLDASSVVLGDNTIGSYAVDTLAPYTPSSCQILGNTNGARLNWNQVEDRGLTYYYMAKSFINGVQSKVSDTIRISALSGLKGYYYYLDNNATGTVTTSHNFVYDEYADITVDDIMNYRYLHVAAIDYAGNLSGTFNFYIPVGVIITFDKNDTVYNIQGNKCTTNATGSMGTQIIIYGTSEKLYKNAYAKKGYVFKDWNTKSDGSGETFTQEQVVNYDYVKNKYGITLTLYAQWKPIEYDIYYDKGSTTDTTTTTITGATRNTDIQQSNILNHPYTHAVFDANVTFANASAVKGRKYELSFDPNLPDTDLEGGAVTQAMKDTYRLTLGRSTIAAEKVQQTSIDIVSSVTDKIARLDGTLVADSFVIKGQDSDVTTNLVAKYNEIKIQPNYKSVNNAYCKAIINWADTTVNVDYYAKPEIDGYVFLGWYDSPNYTLEPKGDGTFTHKPTGNKITDIRITPATTVYKQTVYAHWMPVMAYLNYGADDTLTGRDHYLERANGHLINDLKDGYLTKDVHVGTRYWEYAGRSEAATFFMPEKDLTKYVPYASIPNPALYFDVSLYPRTLVNTKTSVDTTAVTSDNFQVMMPNKFLKTTFKFDVANGGIGNRDTLLNANIATTTWERTEGAKGITYDGDDSKQAESSKFSYNIYDVWTLDGWYLSNKSETRTLDTKITSDTRINNDAKSDKWSFDLAAVWNKRPTDMKMPLPKRLLVFNLVPEGGLFKYSDDGTTDKVLSNLDNDTEQGNLRKLAIGEEVTYADNNVYKGTKIVTDASNSLVYDFHFDAWENTDGTDTVAVNEQAGKDGKINKHSKYYAKWNLDNDLVLPQLEKPGYIFIGWYTVPQQVIPPANTNKHTNKVSSTVEDEEYWVGAGYRIVDGNLETKDCHLQKTCRTINWDINTNQQTLYAWFNREPVFVDMYEGLFFEGQDVSLGDLKKLVGVFDFEDDYNAIALEYIESLPTVEMNALYLPVIVDKDASFEVHHDYSEAEIAQTIQTEDYYFDDSRWEPYSSVYWQRAIEQGEWEKVPTEGEDAEYQDLPTGEEDESGDIENTSANRKIYIENGKLYTPRNSSGIDGVYKSKETGEIYYTAEAKAELAYYVENDEGGSKRNTQLNVRVKKITYKVANKTATEEENVISGIPGIDIRNSDKYDKAINSYVTPKIYERSRYTGTSFVDRKGNTVERPISNWRLDTSTGRIIMKTDDSGKVLPEGEGYFDVTYEITDDGIMFNGAVLTGSPITLTYTRECKIQYNKLPQIYISNIMDFTNTEYASYADFLNMILDAQTVVDGEDNVTNLPWWTYKKTTPKLVRSLEVVKVNKFQFDYALLDKYGLLDDDDNPKSCVTAMESLEMLDLEDLYNDYKCATAGSENWRLWQCMSNFNIIVDAHDQWGKYASGKVVPNWHKASDGGDGKPKVGDDGEGIWVEEITDDDPRPKQPEEFRTITVILINEEDDLSMNAANIMNTVRFIGNIYTGGLFDSLGNTYWGTDGKEKLLEILDRHENGGSSDAYDTNYHNDLGNQVDIHIEDYTTE